MWSCRNSNHSATKQVTTKQERKIERRIVSETLPFRTEEIMSKILIIEDEAAIADLEKDYLELSDFQVDICLTGDEGLQTALAGNYDLVILDLMLPGMDGFEVCKKIREVKNIPILMVSAKKDDIDKIRGLGLGADDYMTKPFAIEELLARIRVGLKKHRAVAAAPAANVLTAGKLVLDPAKYSVTMDGAPISLTKKEFDLLKYLMQHKGQAVTRDALLSDVWGYDYAGDTNVVDVYIRYLRHKIDEPFGVKTIHTIRAVGYMFSYE